MEWEERFSKEHPITSKIKDTDVFLHGTSSKKYLAIQSTGFLRRKVPMRNYGISRKGICFEKYVEHGEYSGVTSLSIEGHCKIACENDQSSEGVILQIKGRELKNLGCPIYADWNVGYPFVKDSEEIPIDVDSNASLLPIIIIDRDIPIKYLIATKRLPFKDLEMANAKKSQNRKQQQ